MGKQGKKKKTVVRELRFYKKCL